MLYCVPSLFICYALHMDSLMELFFHLVAIPSPSGNEIHVAQEIKKCLDAIGVHSYFDGSGEANDSNSGNLIATIKGNIDAPTLLFLAHMDTVETGEAAIRPRLEGGGRIISDGKTILGADNKASVACLIEAAKTILAKDVYPTIYFVFSTREESGKMGSSLLTLNEKVDYAFNLDGPNEIGDFVYQTLGEVPFQIVLHGKAAHAAVEPEKGINAIEAAAQFLIKLDIGKDADGSVLNIGTIQGGQANNIVPDKVVLRGQVRAFEQRPLDVKLERIAVVLKEICQDTNCTYEFKQFPEEGAPPSSLSQAHPTVGLARKATNALDLQFTLTQGSYTSDANYLSKVWPTLTICRGSKFPHSFDEEMSLASLHGLKSLVVSIAEQVIS
jgi:tripeptide aminopeptidase